MHAHAQHVRRSAARAATANPVSYLWPAGDGGRRRSAARGTAATRKGSEEITGGHQRGQRGDRRTRVRGRIRAGNGRARYRAEKTDRLHRVD
jgi:hypothetical protein